MSVPLRPQEPRPGSALRCTRPLARDEARERISVYIILSYT